MVRSSIRVDSRYITFAGALPKVVYMQHARMQGHLSGKVTVLSCQQDTKMQRLALGLRVSSMLSKPTKLQLALRLTYCCSIIGRALCSHCNYNSTGAVPDAFREDMLVMTFRRGSAVPLPLCRCRCNQRQATYPYLTTLNTNKANHPARNAAVICRVRVTARFPMRAVSALPQIQPSSIS